MTMHFVVLLFQELFYRHCNEIVTMEMFQLWFFRDPVLCVFSLSLIAVSWVDCFFVVVGIFIDIPTLSFNETS